MKPTFFHAVGQPRHPIDPRRLRWARREQLAELRQELAQRFDHLDKVHREYAKDLATAGFQLEEVEYALKRLGNGHGNS